MWDRRRTATGPSTLSLSSRHKQRLASHRHLQNQPLLDSDTNTPFNALGISNAVYKYRVHAGKVVPDLYNSDLPPSSPHEDSLEYQHQTILPSDLADQPSPSRISRTLSALFKSDTESDLYQGVVRTDQMSASISSRMAPGQISPPSSPEVVAWRSSPEGEDVSPIDDDSDTLDGSNSPRVCRAKSNKLQSNANRQPSYRDKPAAPLPQHAIPPGKQSSPPQHNPQRLAPMQQSHQLPHRPPQPQFDRGHAPPVSLGQRMKRLAKPRPDANYPQSLGPSSHNQPSNATMSRNNPAINPHNIPTHQPSRRPVATGPPPAGNPAFNTAKPDTKRVSTAMRKLLPVKESAPIGSAVSYYPPNRSYPSPPHDDMVAPPQAQQPPHQAPAGAHNLSSMNSLRRKPPPAAKMDRSSAHANPLGSSPVYSSESDDAKRRGSGSARSPNRDAHATPKEKAMAPSISTDAERETPLSVDTVSRQPRVEHSRAISDSPLAMRSPPLDYSESPQGSPMQLKPAKARPASAMLSPIQDDSAVSKAKPLPPAPPEATAVDRIAQMNAQLSALANRRINLNRGIKQMTELMPPDNSINVDVLIRREEEKKKIEALKADLADIQREEHELGMRLHRAYKRQNKDASYEPTTLWVRRVTG